LALAADEATRTLSEWIGSVTPDTPVNVRSSSDWSPHKGIALRLLSIRPLAAPRGRQPTQNLQLCYLVSVTLDDVLAEHRTLGELVFALADRTDYQLLSQDAATALRSEMSFPPCAGVMLAVNLQRQKQIARMPPVRRPVVVRTAPVAAVEGIVVGPEDVPLMDARVEAPALNLSSQTDFRGRFRLPAAPPTKLIASKNNIRVAIDWQGDQPLTIRIPLES
jgi:hypothetical protein